MKEFEVPVRFTGRITYRVQADDEASAKAIADEMAANEERLGDLEDVDWEAKAPVAMRNL